MAALAKGTLRDKHGNTVELAVLDGRVCMIPRGPNGAVLGLVRGVKKPLPHHPDQLPEYGIDLASLEEV